MQMFAKAALILGLFMGAFLSLPADERPVQPWFDPWGDAREWVEPADFTLAWWWDRENDDVYI